MKRIFVTFLFLFFISINSFSQVINNTQILNSDHWIYDALYQLGKEQKITSFYENTMLTIGEIKFYFNEFEREKLSEAGKQLYDKVDNFLNTKSNLLSKLDKLPLIKDDVFALNGNLILSPELYYKSNPDIDWSFKYNYLNKAGTLPFQLGVSEYMTIEIDPFLGKTNLGASKPNNFTNIPVCADDFEFLFINFAYGSVGYADDKWGANLNISKTGLSIGNTNLGSIFYNKTFETDEYIQANVFTKIFKYSADVVQVDYSKYLYIHQIELRPFKQFKIGIMEGTQVVGPFELRFLNPLMFMHQLSAWNDYDDDSGTSPYGEEKICAYFGINIDWTPIKNVRIFGIFSQNEIQSALEREATMGNLYPDSLAVQLGTEISIPSKKSGYYNINLEGIYTSPYMYIKHTPEASLYRVRVDNLNTDPENNIKSWIGSPYGPDCFAVQAGFGYENPIKWKANLFYTFAVKGENDFSLFDKKTADGKYYNYYPPVDYKIKNPSADDDNINYDDYNQALDDALDMWMHGVCEYRNEIKLNGEYILNNHFSFNGQIIYSFIFNALHEENRFEQGVEIALSATYKLFK